jgi:FkbM family methyltransferase
MDYLYKYGLKKENFTENYQAIQNYLPDLETFYNLLEDQKSKQILIYLITFRILGHRKIKLPVNNVSFWKYMTGKSRFNLKEAGFPIALTDESMALIYGTFILQQYKYENIVKVEDGDFVIDCGACVGETSLYFSILAGLAGKVFAFEFEQENIKKLRDNLALNPNCQNIILIEKAVWNESAELEFIPQGPGSKVFQGSGTLRTQAISIDELVTDYKLNKLDFIKMDIEGAEMNALKGAHRSIKQYKPKLAISIYHSLDDFTKIIQYIDDLRLSYRFYLGHYTIHKEETVLFCLANS